MVRLSWESQPVRTGTHAATLSTCLIGTNGAVERVPERVSGAWVFAGTRVPVRALFENFEEGASVDDSLEWFPGVTREQLLAVLAHAERSPAVTQSDSRWSSVRPNPLSMLQRV